MKLRRTNPRQKNKNVVIQNYDLIRSRGQPRCLVRKPVGSVAAECRTSVGKSVRTLAIFFNVFWDGDGDYNQPLLAGIAVSS